MPTNDSPSLFEDLVSNPTVPHSDEEWTRLDATVCDIFSPHGAVDEETLFAGRTELMLDIIDVVFQKGCHAIIYGERGVGKTSFANILRDKIFHRSHIVKVIKRNCTTSHDYKLIWQHVFDDFEVNGKTSKEYITSDVNAYDIYKLFDSMPANQRTVVIIDEFDRVQDDGTFVKMADTIKYLADEGSRATLIIVGVGENVHELFGGHPSIHRNVRQKLMPKMTKQELNAIIQKRLPIINMSIKTSVKERIMQLSQGFPGYTHLLCQSAFRSAIARRDMQVNEFDLKKAIARSVDIAEETVKESYYKAIRSTKPNHQYKEALLALAQTPTNDKGYFRAKDVKEPFSRVTGKAMDIPNYARHLKEFQEAERGPVLLREGKPKSYEYRFSNPLLRPFAVLAGINDGLIQESDVS
jgi:Cdc6-like AAA superfamily ATPase